MFSAMADMNAAPQTTDVNGFGKKRKSGKSVYKHIPHHAKPPVVVARRNARERRRVQAVNLAFARLRKAVPVENRNKRLSKVKTLQRAIEYIESLRQILKEDDHAHHDGPDDVSMSHTTTPVSWTSLTTPSTATSGGCGGGVVSEVSGYSPTSTNASYQSFGEHSINSTTSISSGIDHHHGHHHSHHNQLTGGSHHHRSNSNLNKENLADTDWLQVYACGQLSFQSNF